MRVVLLMIVKNRMNDYTALTNELIRVPQAYSR
jgi:hypothetical protein